MSAGFNLSGDDSCNRLLTGPGDRPNVDPLLGPLADNGGFTQTYLPQPGSPTIDNGQCLAEVPTDQRGVSRPQGIACDIGAVEVRESEQEYAIYLPLVIR